MTAEIISASVLLLLITAFLIRSAYERRHPVLTEYTVSLKNLPRSFSGVRIVYLTDLHGKNPGKLQERSVSLLKSSQADYVLMGGDMLTVHRGHSFQPEPVLELIKASPAAFPVIYADGNHETRMEEKRDEYPGWAEEFDRLLKEAGVIRLKNGRVILERDGEKIAVASAELPRSTYLKKWSKMPLPVIFKIQSRVYD